jgi:hypothetical protein
MEYYCVTHQRPHSQNWDFKFLYNLQSWGVHNESTLGTLILNQSQIQNCYQIIVWD